MSIGLWPVQRHAGTAWSAPACGVARDRVTGLGLCSDESVAHPIHGTNAVNPDQPSDIQRTYVTTLDCASVLTIAGMQSVVEAMQPWLWPLILRWRTRNPLRPKGGTSWLQMWDIYVTKIETFSGLLQPPRPRPADTRTPRLLPNLCNPLLRLRVGNPKNHGPGLRVCRAS